MCAVKEHHARSSLSGRVNLPRALFDLPLYILGAGRWRRIRVYENVLNTAQAVPLRQRVDFKFLQVDGTRSVGHTIKPQKSFVTTPGYRGNRESRRLPRRPGGAAVSTHRFGPSRY